MYINPIEKPLCDCVYTSYNPVKTIDPTSQVDKHPGAIYTDRDAIYLDPNYRLIN